MVLQDEDLAEYALSEALKQGATYAEARLQVNTDKEASLKNGEVEPLGYGESLGIGMRVMYGKGMAFGATNRLQKDSVIDLARTLVKNAKSASKYFKEKLKMSEEDSFIAKWGAVEEQKLEEIDSSQMIVSLKEMEKEVLSIAGATSIPFRLFYLSLSVEEKFYVNSQGTRLESRVPRVSFFGILTGHQAGNVVQRAVQMGASGGWEVYERVRMLERIKEESKTIVDILAKAEKFSAEEMDVIVGPEVAGIMAHESVGHPSEADRVLGREAAQAGESYLVASDIGRQVGSSQAFISDDPTIPGSSGYYLYDDEGVPARKRRLIVEGRITEFLQNRETASRFGIKSNGAARANDYSREPIVRMANTYVEPGDMRLEEMIRSVKKGVMIKNFMEWNIDDKRLNQRYVGHESYMIENGELKGLVKAPVLEITTPRLWSSVAARSKDLIFDTATCGKGDPMQGIPVWHGGPYMLLKNVKIGAR
ncbi:MAG: TldD/PmbA family protein [Conexivisphaerales archaeon]